MHRGLTILDGSPFMRKRTFLCALAIALLGCGAYALLVEDDTEPGDCELHHIPFSVEIISVRYGLPASGRELTGAQRKCQEAEHAAWWADFRYSHVANGAGGCVPRPAIFAKVSYCPECRKADEAWHAKHGTLPPAK